MEPRNKFKGMQELASAHRRALLAHGSSLDELTGPTATHCWRGHSNSVELEHATMEDLVLREPHKDGYCSPADVRGARVPHQGTVVFVVPADRGVGELPPATPSPLGAAMPPGPLPLHRPLLWIQLWKGGRKGDKTDRSEPLIPSPCTK